MCVCVCIMYFFSANQIEELTGFDSDHFPCLRLLDLHGNKLTSVAGLQLPTLQRLYLASNSLSKCERERGREGGREKERKKEKEKETGRVLLHLVFTADLTGLGGLRKLAILHVRENQIASLDGLPPSMESLQYFNIRYIYMYMYYYYFFVHDGVVLA